MVSGDEAAEVLEWFGCEGAVAGDGHGAAVGQTEGSDVVASAFPRCLAWRREWSGCFGTPFHEADGDEGAGDDNRGLDVEAGRIVRLPEASAVGRIEGDEGVS